MTKAAVVLGRVRRSLISLTVGLALIVPATVAPAHAVAPNPERSGDLSEVLDRAARAADAPALSLQRPQRAASGRNATFATKSLAVDVDNSRRARVRLDAGSDATSSIQLPAVTAGQTVSVLKDGTVVLQGDEVDLTVQVSTESEIRVQTVIHEKGAPTSYTYDLPLEPGQFAKPSEDGGVDVFQGFEGESLDAAVLDSRLDRPWAVDAEGRPVPTWFEVRGRQVTQVVDHSATDAFPVVADPFWIPAIIVGLRVASHVAVKVGSRSIRYAVAPASRVVNALKGYQTLSFRSGSHTFRLDKSGMKHILERHHPKYWDGTAKAQQTFLNPNMSVTDVRATVHAALKQHQATLRAQGTNARIPLDGRVNGVSYHMVVDKGRVVQFYPK